MLQGGGGGGGDRGREASIPRRPPATGRLRDAAGAELTWRERGSASDLSSPTSVPLTSNLAADHAPLVIVPRTRPLITATNSHNNNNVLHAPRPPLFPFSKIPTSTHTRDAAGKKWQQPILNYRTFSDKYFSRSISTEV